MLSGGDVSSRSPRIMAFDANKRMCGLGGVEYRRFETKRESATIDITNDSLLRDYLCCFPSFTLQITMLLSRYCSCMSVLLILIILSTVGHGNNCLIFFR
ncbi:hypothetical protein KIN20_038423 [Parelaphostrongylus tenuis]|uniref:Uncharacterized protein n=1 Tax=Parelaphostrongylus tenuis TaxID=148309 RepID=A0AAD5MTS2_PARTN|nr:hypothetical protein KIN20_038423 [Parelaphostrongylus tenuis]